MPAGEHIEMPGERAPKRTVRPGSAPSSDGTRPLSTQLSLFDAVAVKEETAADGPRALASTPPAPAAKPVAWRPASRRVGARAVDQRTSRVLKVDEMPAYPDEALESVAASLKLLPHAQLWFTYKDIQFFFGGSRATVARRLREGLVPGVRMAGSSVVEDSPVRRFDRDQLKWLLLALRHRRRQLAR